MDVFLAQMECRCNAPVLHISYLISNVLGQRLGKLEFFIICKPEQWTGKSMDYEREGSQGVHVFCEALTLITKHHQPRRGRHLPSEQGLTLWRRALLPWRHRVCVWRHQCPRAPLARTHHAGLRVPLAPIAEGGGQRGGAALVVECGPAVVDGRVDGDGPHARCVAVAVAVIVAAAVARGPHVDAAFAPASLGVGDREGCRVCSGVCLAS